MNAPTEVTYPLIYHAWTSLIGGVTYVETIVQNHIQQFQSDAASNCLIEDWEFVDSDANENPTSIYS